MAQSVGYSAEGIDKTNDAPMPHFEAMTILNGSQSFKTEESLKSEHQYTERIYGVNLNELKSKRTYRIKYTAIIQKSNAQYSFGP